MTDATPDTTQPRKSTTSPFVWRGASLLTLLVLACLAGALTHAGLPCPKTDDAFYKSPAAEWVQFGRLAIPSCRGLVPEADKLFACYPPIYQMALAGWYRCCGVSLTSSLAFCYTIHLLVAGLLMEFSRRMLARTQVGPTAGHLLAVLIGVCHFANTAYFDRQEELAILWLLLELLLCSERSRPLLSGILIGLAGLTSPFVGAIAASQYAIRGVVAYRRSEASFGVTSWRTLSAGAVAFALATTWVVGMEYLAPGIIERQHLWLMAHLKETQNLPSVSDRLAALSASLMYNPLQLPLALGAMFVLVRTLVKQRSSVPTTLFALTVALVIGLVAVAALRPKANTYLGATLMVALVGVPWIWQVVIEEGAIIRRLVAPFLLGGVVSALAQPARLIQVASTTQHDEKFSAVRTRLLEAIPVDDLVAVTPRHWHIFQGRNQWRDAYFASVINDREIRKCEWLILSADVGIPYFIEHFEHVDTVTTQLDPRSSYAYTLWRRRALVPAIDDRQLAHGAKGLANAQE